VEILLGLSLLLLLRLLRFEAWQRKQRTKSLDDSINSFDNLETHLQQSNVSSLEHDFNLEVLKET